MNAAERELVYDFLREYITPAYAANAIIFGQQNNIVLPPDNNDYCIYTFQNGTRQGTTIERYNPDSEQLQLKKGAEVIIHVDCYSGDLDKARQRALSLAMVWRSGVACRFFKNSALMPLYDDTPQDTTIINDSDNYISRWSINLSAYLTHEITLSEPGFSTVPTIRPNALHRATGESTDDGDNRLHVADADVFLRE